MFNYKNRVGILNQNWILGVYTEEERTFTCLEKRQKIYPGIIYYTITFLNFTKHLHKPLPRPLPPAKFIQYPIIHSNWVINFSLHSCLLARNDPEQGYSKWRLHRKSTSPHSLSPDSKCPHLHNSSYIDIALSLQTAKHIKEYLPPSMVTLNSLTTIYFSNKTLYSAPKEERGKKLFEIDLNISGKVSLCYLLDILNIQQSTTFLRTPRWPQHGANGLFSLPSYLFLPFFWNINEHSARVGGDVLRVWMEYADKWDTNSQSIRLFYFKRQI